MRAGLRSQDRPTTNCNGAVPTLAGLPFRHRGGGTCSCRGYANGLGKQWTAANSRRRSPRLAEAEHFYCQPISGLLAGLPTGRLVREKVGLGDDPIDSLPHLLRELDIQCDKSINSTLFRAAVCAAPGRRAHLVPRRVRAECKAIRLHVLPSHPHSGACSGKLSTRTRLALCAQGDHAMLSQSRRANAFAAEFLLPATAIEGAFSEQVVYSLAELYGISSTAARWTSQCSTTTMTGRHWGDRGGHCELCHLGPPHRASRRQSSIRSRFTALRGRTHPMRSTAIPGRPFTSSLRN